jgi:hypothetical protein
MLVTSSALALNQPTHFIVNQVAAQVSDLDNILRDRFSVTDGLNQRFRGQPALEWIGVGGIREDDEVRFLRHFHDPIKPWSSSGLIFFGQHQSSIHWMQRAIGQGNCQEWTWSSARCYFHRALTGSTSAVREQAWADTFRAIGQQMHLVVDASVPEHTRNDPHPLGGLFGSYEYWVSDRHATSELEQDFIARYLSRPEPPDSRLVEELTHDAMAPTSIARLIDANIYTGTDPNVTSTSGIGIAEFANANFFSEDTGYRRFFAPNYSYPSVERLEPSRLPINGGPGVRAYYRKGLGDGRPVDPALAECAMDGAFREDGIPTPQYKCTDKNVWEQTALAMLPRAVGYAAALIDYFFRGLVGAVYQNEGRVLTISGSPAEHMSGTFQLMYDRVNGTRTSLASWTLAVDLGDVGQVAVPQLPTDAEPSAPCWLIFRGQLGLEAGAVTGAPISCPPLRQGPPSTGEWHVYHCATFWADRNYFYATTDPPYQDGQPMNIFYHRQESTGTNFSCDLRTRGWSEQPPNTTTTHPT